MIKVAIILGGLGMGGAETLMLDVMRQWQHAPFSMIGVHRKGGALKSAFYAAGPNMIEVVLHRHRIISYLFHLRKILVSERVNVIHTQMWIDCIYCKLATIGLRIPIINTFHGFYSLNGLRGLLCRWSMQLADKIIFVSQYEQDYYQSRVHINPAKLFVAYNGIDFAKVDCLSKLDNVSLCKKNQSVQLCMVGSFSYSRAHMIICQALTQIQRPFQFYFIGATNEKKSNAYVECYDYCQKHQLLDRVHFVGQQSNVYSWLKDMDGFVYATEHDTFGIAMVEAMAMGLPIVVSDWPVFKEICTAIKYPAVRYFGKKNVNDCIQKINDLLQHLEDSKLEAKSGVQNVRKAYAIETLLTRLLEIYLK